MRKPRFAIIGAGNGGQSHAAHLKVLGFEVQLWDIEAEKVRLLKEGGNKIIVSGRVTGSPQIDLITKDIGEALHNCDVIMVVLPTVFQGSVAKMMAPYLVDGQKIILNPGATGGALEVRTALNEAHCKAKVFVAETDTLLYTCRSPKAGEAVIKGIKEHVNVAALPASDTEQVIFALNTAFPEYRAVPNILYTSLNNANAMMHPTPTVLNAARIEAKDAFDYYMDGLSPSVSKVVESVDSERMAICSAFGIKVDSIQEWYTRCYGVEGQNLYEKVQKVDAYQGVKGPTTLQTRYLFEDLPTGLVPLSQIGKAMGINTQLMQSVVEIGNVLMGKNYWEEGRSLKKLGLDGKTAAEIKKMVM